MPIEALKILSDLENEPEQLLKEIERIEFSKGQLFDLTEHPYLKVRLKAIEKLRKFPGDKEVVEHLRELIFDEEWEVKWAALKSLGHLLEDPLLQKLGNNLGEKRIEAIRKLVRDKRRDLDFALYALLDDERDEVITEALKGLEELKLSNGVQYIILLYRGYSPFLKVIARGVIKSFKERGDLDNLNSIQKERVEAILSDNSEVIICFRCQHPLDWKDIYRAGTWRTGVLTLCKYHYEEFLDGEIPFEGKFYQCRYCDVYWPKYQIVEKACPQCRERRFKELSLPKEGNFRCYRCHEIRPLSRKAPIKIKLKLFLGKVGEQLFTDSELEEEIEFCSPCAIHLASESPHQPYLSDRAVQLLREVEEQEYFFCEKCKKILPISERGFGESFRDYSLCKSCYKTDQ